MSEPLSPISTVRSDNLRLLPDAETVRLVASAFAGLSDVREPRPAISRPPDAPPSPWGSIGARLRAMGPGEATLVAFGAGFPQWLMAFETAHATRWRAERKGTAWIAERLA